MRCVFRFPDNLISRRLGLNLCTNRQQTQTRRTPRCLSANGNDLAGRDVREQIERTQKMFRKSASAISNATLELFKHRSALAIMVALYALLSTCTYAFVTTREATATP